MCPKWDKQQGFSLPETLFALLLFALSLTALLQYQRVLAHGFVMQWQQREAWRNVAQLFEGREITGWRTQLTRQLQLDECQLLTADVSSPLGLKAHLVTLQCGK
ncbi:Prepilin peptidase-dependent protein C precursor [[Pantoea] beijingensis]|uniref:Prepilin peptidase-dependent protein C n=1 Tax=[Pantoea] beijingensis TaxID=1324864 RepID=A0A443ICG5_9GAMM|nr:prepilin-type N-terminal cleavage/methylation domain-containing protein [[Pantoea] beijingensis]RWR01743.1 Prepilin peptidase-dependent protein C precursor [[Pantoea] beijingensis]